MTSVRRTTAAAAFVICGLAVAQAQGPQDWRAVGYDAGGSKYSPLTQITPANVSRLKVAWSYDFGGAGAYTITPIVVSNVLYFPHGTNIVALKADAGTELWKFDMKTIPELGGEPLGGRPRHFVLARHRRRARRASSSA